MRGRIGSRGKRGLRYEKMLTVVKETGKIFGTPSGIMKVLIRNSALISLKIKKNSSTWKV